MEPKKIFSCNFRALTEWLLYMVIVAKGHGEGHSLGNIVPPNCIFLEQLYLDGSSLTSEECSPEKKKSFPFLHHPDGHCSVSLYSSFLSVFASLSFSLSISLFSPLPDATFNPSLGYDRPKKQKQQGDRSQVLILELDNNTGSTSSLWDPQNDK